MMSAISHAGGLRAGTDPASLKNHLKTRRIGNRRSTSAAGSGAVSGCARPEAPPAIQLARRAAAWFIILRLRIWWNWQTRYFEVVVPQGVQVQVLLCAPLFLWILRIRRKFAQSLHGIQPGRPACEVPRHHQTVKQQMSLRCRLALAKCAHRIASLILGSANTNGLGLVRAGRGLVRALFPAGQPAAAPTR